MRHYALKGLRIFAIINYFTESSCKKFYFSKCRLIFLTLKFSKIFMFKVRYPHIYFFSIFKCEKNCRQEKVPWLFFIKVNILKIGMYLEICYYRCEFGNMSSNSSQPSESHYCKLQEAFLPCCCPLKPLHNEIDVNMYVRFFKKKFQSDTWLLLTGIYFFKINNRNTRSMLTIKLPEWLHWRLLLTLNGFHTFLWCSHGWIWTSKCWQGYDLMTHTQWHSA